MSKYRTKNTPAKVLDILEIGIVDDDSWSHCLRGIFLGQNLSIQTMHRHIKSSLSQYSQCCSRTCIPSVSFMPPPTVPTFMEDIICDTWLSSGVRITPGTGRGPAAPLLGPVPPTPGVLYMDRISAADAYKGIEAYGACKKGLWGDKRKVRSLSR